MIEGLIIPRFDPFGITRTVAPHDQVDARGRQQWSQIPMMQLVLWTLALERTVWRMPLYHRVTPPRRVLLTLQISWLPYFTN
jgi:hypothetical protein